MKKGICYGCLPGKLTPREKLTLCKDAGLDGVEFPTFDTQKETEEVAAIAQEVGIEVHSVMAGSHWDKPLSSTDEVIREAGVAGIKHALRVAKWAGADTVLVVPGVVTADCSYAAAYDLSKKSLREILPTAEELGITMALENVWNKFLLSPIEFRDYIDSFNSPLIKAYFDVGNILLYGYPHQWVDILDDRIVKVHIKDFDVNTRQFVSLLSGSVDFPRFINALHGADYTDYLTIEIGPYAQYPEHFVHDMGRHLDQIINS